MREQGFSPDKKLKKKQRNVTNFGPIFWRVMPLIVKYIDVCGKAVMDHPGGEEGEYASAYAGLYEELYEEVEEGELELTD